MIPILTTSLLAEFDALVRSASALIAQCWAPGLTDRRIDELLAPHSIDLPDEARTWWRWHNGTLPDRPSLGQRIVPGRDLLSLESALDLYATVDAFIWEVHGVANQIQIVGDKPMIRVDCNGRRDEPAPVFSQNDETDPPLQVLSSMHELVTLW